MLNNDITRRDLMRQLGLSASAISLVGWLPSLSSANSTKLQEKPQRIIWVFSPNGVIQDAFWPKVTGSEFELSEILTPLAPYRDQTLVLKGIDNRVRGDGDDHMRGMSCLLTGIELFPGNIQGGGNTPSGWPRGHSIDQELKRFLQSNTETQTRFGSLEFGVLVPESADVWTRWSYSGPNRPITPISNPQQMMKKLFGDPGETKTVRSVLDAVAQDIDRVMTRVSADDRHLLDAHLQAIRESELRIENDLQTTRQTPPEIDVSVVLQPEQMPLISDVQQNLMVAAFQSDQARLATLQYDKSVGNIRMTFIGINEGHHELSHDPDDKKDSMEKLIKIDQWYCQQIANLAQRLSETPEVDGTGPMLDNTTIIWTNELGKGNSHTLNDIPFVLVGSGLGLKSGQALAFDHMPHNRLWITLANALGHRIESFGNEKLSSGGIIADLWA